MLSVASIDFDFTCFRRFCGRLPFSWVLDDLTSKPCLENRKLLSIIEDVCLDSVVLSLGPRIQGISLARSTPVSVAVRFPMAAAAARAVEGRDRKRLAEVVGEGAKEHGVEEKEHGADVVGYDPQARLEPDADRRGKKLEEWQKAILRAPRAFCVVEH